MDDTATYALLGGAMIIFIALMAAKPRPTDPAVTEQRITSLTDSGYDDVMEAVERGQKIEAIKRFRALTGCGLKKAKDAVEQMERGRA